MDNFNNIGRALKTIFIVLIGEDWNWTMYQWVRALGTYSTSAYIASILYFMLVMILGNIILFSLFTAIMLRNFEVELEDESDDEEESLADKLH